MATYLDREQIRHRRAIQKRYDADQQRMAALIAFLLMRYARFAADGKRTIPTDPQTRLAIKAAIWLQILKPYYIGNTEPFDADRPQSPFATLLRDGVQDAIRIQVQRQESLLKRYIKDVAILAWFTMPNQRITLPEVKHKNFQEPYWNYTDPNGYKLNDRILRNAVDSRARIDRMLDYHITQGTDASTLGDKIRNFMTISGLSTGKPYGEYGSYAPWRLLRIEMVQAAGRATVLGTMLNPVADRLWWRVSYGHVEIDPCDHNASGGPDGDGIYSANQFPLYPNHPGELCSIIPVAADNMDEIKMDIQGHLANNSPTAQLWRGTMNEQSLIRALMTQHAGEKVTA